MIKDRKIFLILIALSLIALGLIILTARKEKIPEVLLLEEGREILRVKEEVKAISAFSVKENTEEAIKEILEKIKESFKEDSPEFTFLFSTVGYDYQKIIEEIKKEWPKIKIYGGTSMLAVQSEKGFHQGEKSLTLMAISSPRIIFGVGGADVEKVKSAKQAGRQAILSAIENAEQQGKIPQIVLITGSVFNEEELLSGIEEIIGKEVPIVGGSAADNDITGQWKQFANNQVFSNGVSLAAIFTDLKVSSVFEAGYLVTKEKGVITKAKGRIIYEIDNLPAAEVYNQWTEGLIREKLERGGIVADKTTFYPLAKIIRGKDGQVHYLSIHPLSVNLPEKSLTVFANVEKGEEVLLMKGTWEILLNRARSTPLKCLEKGGFERNQAYFGLYTFCAGPMLAIPEEERIKMPLLIKESIGDQVPFVGTFTFGEQGYLAGVGNRHGNLINSMVIIGPKK